MTRRLFVAVEIPPMIQAQLYAAAALLRERAALARVTRRENFHITLAFLGETDGRRMSGAPWTRHAHLRFR